MVIIKIILWTDRWILLFLQVFYNHTYGCDSSKKKKKSLERKKEKKGYFLIFEIFRISRSFDFPHPLDNFQIESDNLDNETGMIVSFLNYL